MAATSVFLQVFTGHKYYLAFNEVRASSNYHLGSFFDWDFVKHDDSIYLVELYNNLSYYCDPDQVKDHRLQWDLGGFSMVSACRLGDKPSFKEGGMLGTYPSPTHTWAGSWAEHAPAHKASRTLQVTGRRHRAKTSKLDQELATTAPFSPTSALFPSSFLLVLVSSY
jgi:hypothetical protein